MGKLQSIQILRFVAAVMVVHFHALLFPLAIVGGEGLLGSGHLNEMGPAGVDIFFVISGLVIGLTGPLATPRPTGARYFWMRWSRVAPFFYVASLPMIAVWAIAGQLTTAKTVATFLFWPMAGGTPVTPYLAPGWSLCFEMIFYTSISLLLIGGRLSRNLEIGAVVVAVLVAARAFGWAPAHILANPIFIEFAFGLGLAWALPWLRRRNPWIGAALIGCCMCLFAVGAVVGVGSAFDGETVLNDVRVPTRVMMLGIPAAALVAGSLICESWARGRIAHVLSRLGDASYSLYLSHLLVLRLLTVVAQKTPFKAPADLLTLFAITLCVGVGWLTHLYVERPILRDVRALGGAIAPPFRPSPASPSPPPGRAESGRSRWDWRRSSSDR